MPRYERSFSRDRHNPGLDSLGLGQKLPSYRRAGSICANQQISLGSRAVFKVRDHAAIRTLFVTLESLFEIHNVFQASEQNLTKSDAADGNLSRLGVWAVNHRKCQKSLQVGVQKVDRLVRFCGGTKKLLEQSCGKALLQCSRSI